MKPVCVTNTTVVSPGVCVATGTFVFTDRIAKELRDSDPLPPGCEVIDGRGKTLTPGLVDIHHHGIGRHLYENSAEDLVEGLKTPARFGVTSVCPTLYAELKPTSLKHLESLASALPKVTGVHVPGFHLEGPFLAITGAGGLTMNPDVKFLDELLAACGGKVSAMSLSPEKPGVIAVIERLVEKGITPFLTHTRASYEQTWAAIDAGATHATHFYDVFPLPEETDPGVRPVGAVEAFLGHPKSTVDFICDGVHVHPGAIRAAMAARGWENVIAITDSNIGAGLPAGVYPTTWGHEVSVSPENAARIHHPISPKHGALAGSSLTLNRAVANLSKWFKLNPPQLWAIATSNPARVIRSDRGGLAVGAVADLVLWNDDFTPSRTWVGGQLVYSQETS